MKAGSFWSDGVNAFLQVLRHGLHSVLPPLDIGGQNFSEMLPFSGAKYIFCEQGGHFLVAGAGGAKQFSHTNIMLK